MRKRPIRQYYSDALILESWERHAPSFKAAESWLFSHHLVAPEASRPGRKLLRRWLLSLGALGEQPVKPKSPTTGPKVLSIDIETRPLTAFVWSLWKQNVGLNQIAEEWRIMSFCAKWMHEDDPIYMDARANPDDDGDMLNALWSLLDEADIVITQNGKRFDVPKINARLVMHGHQPYRPIKVVDTMLMAKQQFGFTSKKLEWMTDQLCSRHKKSKHTKFPGFELWRECMLGNEEAWDEMREYNIPDVLSMEELYLILRPWYVGHPNVAIYYKDDKPTLRCPKCGSDHVKVEGVQYTQSGEYEQVHCHGCGGWSRGRYTLNSKEVRRVQLSN